MCTYVGHRAKAGVGVVLIEAGGAIMARITCAVVKIPTGSASEPDWACATEVIVKVSAYSVILTENRCARIEVLTSVSECNQSGTRMRTRSVYSDRTHHLHKDSLSTH